MTESSLSQPVSNWMRSRGLTVYAEVPYQGRSLDLVGYSEERALLVAVELKRNASDELLRQVTKNRDVANESWGIVGSKPQGLRAVQWASRALGLATCDGRAVTILTHPHVVEGYPMLDLREKLIGALIRGARDGEAGKPNLPGSGRLDHLAKRVREYQEQYPALRTKWRMIHRDVTNPFSTPQAMKKALRDHLRNSTPAS